MTPWQIECALDDFARSGGFRARDPYYIVGEIKCTTAEGEELYSDEAHLWCEDCAKAILAKALPVLPRSERDLHLICMADVGSGEDTPSHCAACGHALDHILTEAGVEYEVDHYASHPVDKISAAEAFGIARLVESAPTDKDVLAIGRAALRAIRAGKIRKSAEGR